jgi:CRP-like cAMP-binding protein
MIDQGDRTASIEAVSDLECYGLTFWDFRPLIESDARIAWPLLQAMAKRLRAAEADA